MEVFSHVYGFSQPIVGKFFYHIQAVQLLQYLLVALLSTSFFSTSAAIVEASWRLRFLLVSFLEATTEASSVSSVTRDLWIWKSYFSISCWSLSWMACEGSSLFSTIISFLFYFLLRVSSRPLFLPVIKCFMHCNPSTFFGKSLSYYDDCWSLENICRFLETSPSN